MDRFTNEEILQGIGRSYSAEPFEERKVLLDWVCYQAREIVVKNTAHIHRGKGG